MIIVIIVIGIWLVVKLHDVFYNVTYSEGGNSCYVSLALEFVTMTKNPFI